MSSSDIQYAERQDTTSVIKNMINQEELSSIEKKLEKCDDKSVLSHLGKYIEEPYKIIEAYFGENDWYPNFKEELESFDPQGYFIVESLFK